MLRIKCPCCGFFTHQVENVRDPLFEICEVCFWQYDTKAHDTSELLVGANHISLADAIENYKQLYAVEKKYCELVREPFADELPERN